MLPFINERRQSPHSTAIREFYQLTAPITYIMASIICPSLVRHSCLSLAARTTFIKQAPRTLSKINASTFPSQIITSRPPPFGSSTLNGVPCDTLRVATFHTSGRRAILPAGPR